MIVPTITQTYRLLDVVEEVLLHSEHALIVAEVILSAKECIIQAVNVCDSITDPDSSNLYQVRLTVGNVDCNGGYAVAVPSNSKDHVRNI